MECPRRLRFPPERLTKEDGGGRRGVVCVAALEESEGREWVEHRRVDRGGGYRLEGRGAI